MKKQLPHDSLFITLHSNRTLDFARAQATRADIDALHLAVHNGAYALDIRIPAALRLQVGMADIHAAHWPLVANFTNMCHL